MRSAFQSRIFETIDAYSSPRCCESECTVFDVAIIGSGVVGCAVARSLSMHGLSCVVLESSPTILSGASKGNSGVFHTGFDATPGTLEQRCMTRGWHLFQALLKDAPLLPHRKSGALMVAWNTAEQRAFEDVRDRATSNGVLVDTLTPDELYHVEPGLEQGALGGVLVPGEALVDPWLTPTFYLLQAIDNGTQVMLNFHVRSATKSTCCGRNTSQRSFWKLSSSAKDVFAHVAINCAGTHGDEVEKMRCGVSPDFFIRPRHGQFVVFQSTLAGPHQPDSNHILLPIPTGRTKGVLMFGSVHRNAVLVGPTAEEKEDRDVSVACPDTASMLEQRGASISARFAADLKRGDLLRVATYTGIRPATQYRDYIIRSEKEAQWITVAGIRSTGLSASLGIAEHVANELCKTWGYSPHLRLDGHSRLNTPARTYELCKLLMDAYERTKRNGGKNRFRVSISFLPLVQGLGGGQDSAVPARISMDLFITHPVSQLGTQVDDTSPAAAAVRAFREKRAPADTGRILYVQSKL